jgi:hypothetical protein
MLNREDYVSVPLYSARVTAFLLCNSQRCFRARLMDTTHLRAWVTCGHVAREKQDRQRNNEVLSCNHCCSEKAMSITYSECMFVALGVQHAMGMRRIVMCPARLYHIFPHYPINGTIFEKTLLNTKCVLIFSTTFVWNISHFKKKWARYDKKN